MDDGRLAAHAEPACIPWDSHLLCKLAVFAHSLTSKRLWYLAEEVQRFFVAAVVPEALRVLLAPHQLRNFGTRS